VNPTPGEPVYRLLLRLYPSEFRRRYEPELLAFYRERRRGSGTGARAGILRWCRILSDLVRSAAAEHGAAILTRLTAPNRPEHRMDTLWQDLRMALRGLGRAPAFTAVVLVTLALGIGANAAIFSVVNAVLLRPLPYDHAGRMLVLWHSNQAGRTGNAVAPPEYFDLKEQSRAFDRVVPIRPQASTITGDGAEPERLQGYVVTPEFFETLGARPALGRDFRPEDGVPGAERVILLSDALWRRRFGADSGVLGRRVTIAGFPRLIVGVMPPGVRFPDAPVGFLRQRADLWIPSSYESLRGDERGNQFIGAMARIRDGVGETQAIADLDQISARFRAAFPARYGAAAVKGWRLDTVPLVDQMVGAVRPALLVLVGAVGLVLLIACVNVANLLLARGTLRQRDVAVRLALGADRGRLVRQMLTESTLLSLGGGALGVLLAWAGVPLLLQLDRGNIPRLDGAGLSTTVVGFAVLVSLATGILVGMVPAFQHSRSNLGSALTEGTRGSSDGRGKRRLRSSLVAAQIAMALVILVGAGLLGRSFAALHRVDPGLDPAGAITLQLNLPGARYDSATKVLAFYERVLPAIAAIPGVTAAAAVTPLPLSGQGWSGSIDVEGLVVNPGDPEPHAEYSVATPGYFRAAGIEMLAGRDFAPQDVRGGPGVVVVDERLAEKYWPDQSALGKRLNTGERDWSTVIGVVRHVYRAGPGDEGEPQLYKPLTQHTEWGMAIVVRTGGEPAGLAGALRREVNAADPDLPTAQVRTMEDLMSQATARQRFNLLMLGVFALVALGLASVGLYGVMSYLVAQRTREIGIRIALGGQPGQVWRIVVRESLLIAGAGLLAGTAISLALSRVVQGLLFGVSATDLTTYVAISGLLLFVAALAAFGPARRATRVDPLVALRE
jgi:predicted permease